MKIEIKTYFLFILLLLPFLSISQQLPQFNQYMFNTISINPAYAGTREKLNVTFLNRNQWVGLEGAPVTQTLTMDMAVSGTNLGVGLSFIQDKLGYEQTTYLYADFSYYIKLNMDYILSFGLKAGFSKYDLDPELLSIQDRFLDNIFNKMKPNFGAGIYLRNDDLFIGLSSPRLVSYNNDTTLEYKSIERASYYLNGGYLLEFTPQLIFKPTFLLKYTNGAPLSLDLTANFLINEKLWLGAAYRLNDAIGGLVSIQATNAMRFGYSYEFNTSDIRPYTSGSHEVFISYEFEFPRPRCNCENKF